MSPFLYAFVFIVLLIAVKVSHLQPPNHYLPLGECDPPGCSNFEFTRGWFELNWKITCRSCGHPVCCHHPRTLFCKNPPIPSKIRWL
jgi:hypothetical protein